MQVPLTLWQEDAFHSSNSVQLLFFGFYYGLITCILLINFVQWLKVRDSLYIAFVGQVAAHNPIQLCFDGLEFQYFWGFSPGFASVSQPLAACLSLLIR